MRVGTTTFGFRYLLHDPARAPALTDILDQARALGLEILQVCENARPLELDDDKWGAVAAHATAIGLELQLGCKTTRLEVLNRYLRRAAGLPSKLLRLAFEEEHGAPPGRVQIDEFLRQAAPLLEQAGVRLAIENHFEVPSSMLRAAVEPYPATLIGFCVDTANSLRNFESPERVMELLGPRAFCYHLKDFRVDGHMLGFSVTGAPLGAGKLDVDRFLDAVFARDPSPEILLENWVPATGNWEADVAEDRAWLTQSLAFLREKTAARH